LRARFVCEVFTAKKLLNRWRGTAVLAAVFVVMLTLWRYNVAEAQAIDLDSLSTEAGGRLLDHYLIDHHLAVDSVRFSTINELRLPAKFRNNTAARSLTVYDIHSELMRGGGSLDSLHTTLSGIFIPASGGRSEKVLLESIEAVKLEGEIDAIDLAIGC
jgi:hypothetical protein